MIWASMLAGRGRATGLRATRCRRPSSASPSARARPLAPAAGSSGQEISLVALQNPGLGHRDGQGCPQLPQWHLPIGGFVDQGVVQAEEQIEPQAPSTAIRTPIRAGGMGEAQAGLPLVQEPAVVEALQQRWGAGAGGLAVVVRGRELEAAGTGCPQVTVQGGPHRSRQRGIGVQCLTGPTTSMPDPLSRRYLRRWGRLLCADSCDPGGDQPRPCGLAMGSWGEACSAVRI
jgi:hypothetical protein